VKNKPVLLKDGTLMCPSSTEGDEGWRVHFECTRDFGKTWTKIGRSTMGRKSGLSSPAS
jgi:alpha-L-rhamnosidase